MVIIGESEGTLAFTMLFLLDLTEPVFKETKDDTPFLPYVTVLHL